MVLPACMCEANVGQIMCEADEADISQFDENGKLKTDSKKKKKSNTNGRFNVDNGLISKKNPKQLKSKGRKRV